jgi:hypothetical protein
MPRCPNCGKQFGYPNSDAVLCGSCESAGVSGSKSAQRKEWEKSKEYKALERFQKEHSPGASGSSHSGPMPLWVNIVLGVLVLGVAFFFAYRAGIVDRAIGGIAGLFGNEAASDNAGVEVIRKTDWSKFANEPQTLSDSETAAGQEAVTAFMQSGASYRMSGSIKYGYLSNDGGFQEFQMALESSYNSELDVYKFVLSDMFLDGDEKLEQYFGSFREGTYYIVNEGGNTYVLSDMGGERTVSDASENPSLYNTLMGLRMESVIGFDFFSEESFRAYNLNGGTAYKADDLGEESINYNPIEIILKTYGDMPVYHYFCREDRDLGLQRQFDYNFYYDRIPDDNPTIADWN